MGVSSRTRSYILKPWYFSYWTICAGCALLFVSYLSLRQRGGVLDEDIWLHQQQQQLPPISITGTRHVEGNIWGGYWQVDTTFSAPPTPPTAREVRPGPWKGSCHDLAAKAPQPFSELYMPRHAPASALPGGAPRAWHQWAGNISWADFQEQATPRLAGRRKKRVIKYKVIGNQLYRHGGCGSSLYSQFAEEMMLVALHLFDVPDTDFALQFGDSCPFPGMPVIAWGICRNNTGRGGFTMPSYRTWQHALGPQQQQVLHQCFAARYPTDMSQRVPDVVWRGSTTDPFFEEFNKSTYLQAARVRLHYMSRNSTVLNTHLTGILQATRDVEGILGPTLAKEMPGEDAMKHAAIIDLDGNGWSDRFHTLTHYNTPVLKQVSNFTGFFEHLIAPGHSLHQFANDLSDLEEKAQALVRAAHTPGGADHLFSQAARRQGISAAVLNQVAVAEAMAYTITAYANRTSWKVGSSTAYHAIPWTACCRLNPSLPKELVRHIRSRPPPPSMYQLRAAGLQPGPEGDSTQAIHLRIVTRLEELRHRTFYPYLWETFW
eukprot:CAMPEP_0202353124 /NCGR_PEP_ID=MMETSP1126-20121109/9021_1 /ASSEMBLY_ACC=CAM_ASM_000457 /TAXON_ID=3047 /ORGANISM="Dunaliella tertiolecta, Strain CCMP1320" /LENGTH=545 /DNA_ID=CAMNT_0048945431 /DNA_START=75 /DNA_END=1709 /DNA_ORIENTATION=+